MRGPADQRDVDVDVAQFRDVITAGREILHVDVPERVKQPTAGTGGRSRGTVNACTQLS